MQCQINIIIHQVLENVHLQKSAIDQIPEAANILTFKILF